MLKAAGASCKANSIAFFSGYLMTHNLHQPCCPFPYPIVTTQPCKKASPECLQFALGVEQSYCLTCSLLEVLCFYKPISVLALPNRKHKHTTAHTASLRAFGAFSFLPKLTNSGLWQRSKTTSVFQLKCAGGYFIAQERVEILSIFEASNTTCTTFA